MSPKIMHFYSDKMSLIREEIFNMTQKEITRLRVVNQVIDKAITVKEGIKECISKKRYWKRYGPV